MVNKYFRYLYKVKTHKVFLINSFAIEGCQGNSTFNITCQRSSLPPGLLNLKLGLLTQFQISLGMKVERMKVAQEVVSYLQLASKRERVRTTRSTGGELVTFTD